MTQDQAVQFLKAHQPMPSTSELQDVDMHAYDQVRRFFLENPNRICIPLFLNSFGEGDGLGVYQLVEDVIYRFPADEVVPHLAQSLRSPYKSVRYWSAQIATRFPSENLIDALSNLLIENDYDMKYVAITALEQIGGERVRKILNDCKYKENDHEIQKLINEVLSEM